MIKVIKIKKERLEEFMNFRRWSKTNLAQALGYSESYITLLMKEDREPSAEFMDRLVTITGLSFDELFFCLNSYKNVNSDVNNLPKSN